ncbi:HAD hydrolase-like protein [Akkermansiaceae bacterium]|nr:HAD hydrolase-like protein [Akkermansiaceae bacterium]MDB4537119.1 HAD hydrolase-like protein [Akkermansiaceae bacterium]
MSSRLVLFDIDCTLIDTGGAGLSAIRETAERIFGNEGPPLDLAGSTDSGIVRGLFEHFGRSFDSAVEEEFYQVYLPLMQRNLKSDEFDGEILPGVDSLIAALESDGHTLGLLTGNIEQGAIVKASHYGLAEHFQFGAYGDDHWDRNLLGPIALERANRHTGKLFSAEDVLVIGDTPKDVACAHALGAPCLAVATGSFTVDQLRECGAHQVLETLDGAEETLFSHA